MVEREKRRDRMSVKSIALIQRAQYRCLVFSSGRCAGGPIAYYFAKIEESRVTMLVLGGVCCYTVALIFVVASLQLVRCKGFLVPEHNNPNNPPKSVRGPPVEYHTKETDLRN